MFEILLKYPLKFQVVATLSIPQWEAIKAKLSITECQISHDEVLENKH
jgi:hypothetical protein